MRKLKPYTTAVIQYKRRFNLKRKISCSRYIREGGMCVITYKPWRVFILIIAGLLLLAIVIYCTIKNNEIIRNAEGNETLWGGVKVARQPVGLEVRVQVPPPDTNPHPSLLSTGNDCNKQLPVGRVVLLTKVSIFHAVRSQTDSSPKITANNTRIKDPERQRIIALSRELLNNFKGRVSGWVGGFDYGDRVVIKGCGKYDGSWTVRDCMANRRRNKGRWEYIRMRGDLLVGSKTKGGRWWNVEMRKK